MKSELLVTHRHLADWEQRLVIDRDGQPYPVSSGQVVDPEFYDGKELWLDTEQARDELTKFYFALGGLSLGWEGEAPRVRSEYESLRRLPNSGPPAVSLPL